MLTIRSLSASRTRDGISLSAGVYLPSEGYTVAVRRSLSSTGRVEKIYLRAVRVENPPRYLSSKREVSIDISGEFSRTVLVTTAGAATAKRVSIRS